jgi:hypothetical protein
MAVRIHAPERIGMPACDGSVDKGVARSRLSVDCTRSIFNGSSKNAEKAKTSTCDTV